MVCNRCNMLIFSGAVYDDNGFPYHKKCMLKHELEQAEEEIKRLEEQLGKYNRLTYQFITDAKYRHKEKGRKSSSIVMSGEFYQEVMKDVDFHQGLYRQAKVGSVKQPILVFMGMKVIIRDNIVGWYIQ